MSGRSYHALSADQPSQSDIDRAIAQLVETFHPLAIYLFGSLPAGHRRPESSIDMLIVAPDVASIRFLERIKRAIQATTDVLPNIAPLVYTPEEVKTLKEQGDGFLQDIMEEGKLVFEQKN